MKPRFERLRSRTAVFLHDLIMSSVAWLLAYWLRFNLGYVPPEFIEDALSSLSGQEFGNDLRAWHHWWKENEEKLLEERLRRIERRENRD